MTKKKNNLSWFDDDVLSFTSSIEEVPVLENVKILEHTTRIVPLLRDCHLEFKLNLMQPYEKKWKQLFSQIVYIDLVECNYMPESFDMDPTTIYMRWYQILKGNPSYWKRKAFLIERGVIYLIDYRTKDIMQKLRSIYKDEYIDPDQLEIDVIVKEIERTRK